MSPKTDRHAASLNLRMPLEMRAQLQDVADELGIDVSVVARTALSLGLPKTRSAIEDAIEQSQMADAVPLGGSKKNSR